MDREYLTDEDIHGLEEDSEITVLQNKLDKANEFIKNKGQKFEDWENGFCIRATVEYTKEEIFELIEILSE